MAFFCLTIILIGHHVSASTMVLCRPWMNFVSMRIGKWSTMHLEVTCTAMWQSGNLADVWSIMTRIVQAYCYGQYKKYLPTSLLMLKTTTTLSKMENAQACFDFCEGNNDYSPKIGVRWKFEKIHHTTRRGMLEWARCLAQRRKFNLWICYFLHLKGLLF